LPRGSPGVGNVGRLVCYAREQPMRFLYRPSVALAVGFASSLLVGGDAFAVTLRIQVDQRGDFVVIGNTLGFDCSLGTPPPVVGSVGDCGVAADDDTPDVFWRSDEPAVGEAFADHSITVAEARSSAVLELPAGASVTHAFLYWAARETDLMAIDLDATFERPGVFSQQVNALDSVFDPVFPIYQSVAEVTAVVQQHGAGVYRVGGVSSMSFVDVGDQVQFAAWSLVVFYERDVEPPRNLALFDGLDHVDAASGQSIVLSGFLVPNAAFDGKLGVIAYEGDNQGVGDQLAWDGNLLENALNPSTNFFNGTRSILGAPAYVSGDLPQLAGTAQSTSGLDLDVVDIEPFLAPGQTSAVVDATTTSEIYWLGGFITSVSTIKPEFSTASKSALDIDGGALLAGDEVEYTIVVTNTGSDASVGTVLTDPLAGTLALVPGSIAITSGANAGAKTEDFLDDQADYDAPTNTLTVRLGEGANATQGGSLAIGESTTLVFRAAIDAQATGTIENQATITASGAQGAPSDTTVTDGNGPAPGSPPTTVIVDQCGTDAHCPAELPHCWTEPDPNVCVECLIDAHCPPLEPTCDRANKVCGCAPVGLEVCGNASDEDCDGELDNGCGGAGGGGGGATGGHGGQPAGSGPTTGTGEGELDFDGGALEGGGCDCSAPPGRSSHAGSLLVLLAVAGACGRRRRVQNRTI